HLGRIVHRPEHLQELVVRDHVGVEDQLDHLGVTGSTGAHLTVCRIVHGASAVAGYPLEHPRDTVEDPLDAPETTGAEGRGFGRHGNLHSFFRLRVPTVCRTLRRVTAS